MYYNMLLERWEKSEAIDILHFNCGMKKIFGPLLGAEDTNIFAIFSWIFEYLLVGNFGS